MGLGLRCGKMARLRPLQNFDEVAPAVRLIFGSRPVQREYTPYTYKENI